MAIQRDIFERDTRFFEAEADRLDGWADDLKVGLECEINKIDHQIKKVRQAATIGLILYGAAGRALLAMENCGGLGVSPSGAP